MADIRTIAFIGLGAMGRPMARNLLKGGFSLRVNDLVRAAAAEIEREGAVWTSCPAEAVQGADCVITDNEARGADVSGAQTATGGAATGGGVEAAALNLVNARVAGNRAVGGTATTSGPFFTARGGAATGGGVYATGLGPITVTNSTVADNQATGGPAWCGSPGRSRSSRRACGFSPIRTCAGPPGCAPSSTSSAAPSRASAT